MSDFLKAYGQLNAAQKKAVDAIDGPLLVIAGPGTGKTQLLSLRVANILNKTDTPAQNVLCLTFTENGAANMRERLSRFIGQDAYSVHISTYHAFGGDLIRRFPEYFGETLLENPVDELTRHQILETIVEKLRYDNPLKQTRWHLQDLISTVGEVKRALLSSDDLRNIATENNEFIEQGSQRVAITLEDFKRMPNKFEKAAPFFEKILQELKTLAPEKPEHSHFGSLAHIATNELEAVIGEAEGANSTKPLTEWKNKWLAKDSDNRFIIDGKRANERIYALAGVFESYENELKKHRLYDFDDMILRSIEALGKHDDLRFTLQEKYLYLLLDEFQDTNAAQLKLIELLTNNPVAEGRPNVMAVGDDDQAIYAFQGAEYSNMLDFYNMYRDVQVVSLTENYRSHGDILHTAEEIATQIDARLHHNFENSSKNLTAANKNLSEAKLDRHEFLSDVAEYDWIAKRIAELVKEGVSASEIAVLAPKHKQLEPLVAYLNEYNVPVRYEKRENILETSIVRQLLTMGKLVVALSRGNFQLADSLWPEVLSYDFWEIPLEVIWQFSWQVRDSYGEQSWSKNLLAHENPKIENMSLKQAVMLLASLSMKAEGESLETMLDCLIGSCELDIHDAEGNKLESPLRKFYTSEKMRGEHPEMFYETLSHLTVLRAKLRDYQNTLDKTLTLKDLIEFVEMYERAGQRMINASPYAQASDAVNLLTVFKAKGLEFQHVFLPHALDDVWGESSRGNSNRISLPANLAPIRHAGANQDERLRILFVALTRAKTGLHITSHTTKYSGKSTKRLKYLAEEELPEGGHKITVLPEHAQKIHTNDLHPPRLETLKQHWHARHLKGLSEIQLQDLLQERLKHYQLSPTHLGDFIDLENCGPREFFLKTILGFPGAPTPEIVFGNAIHKTLEWIQYQDTFPEQSKVTERFAENLRRHRLLNDEVERLLHRGKNALKVYLAQRKEIFEIDSKAEQNFRREGVFIGKAHLAGNIDRMEINEKDKTITVVDFKTGKAQSRWERSVKMHKYAQQLYCYKLLIENSKTYKNYTVQTGRIEFIEPDENGNIHSLELPFKPEQTEATKKLLQAVWEHIQRLNFPEAEHDASISGILKFEQDLIDTIDK